MNIWRGLAIPGVVWLILFVVVPAYAVLAVAMGKIDALLQPVPIWNPLEWNVGFVKEAFASVVPGGTYWSATRNTLVYVAATIALCFAIGYPVAYYIARHASGRTKALLLLLIFLPFWVSYLMRMLAWIGLLAPNGYVNEVLGSIGFSPHRLAERQPVLGDRGAHLRLHPVLHPARLRGPRPDRPAAAGGGARPRRLARSAPSCASPCRSAGRASSPARS